MRNIARFLFLIGLFSAVSYAQKPKPKNTPKKVASTAKTASKSSIKNAAKSAIDEGKVVGKTYTNETFNFEITFPDTWLIPGKDFEEYMLKEGIDIRLKPPTAVNPQNQAELKKAINRVSVLLTAYRALPGMPDNSIMRVSVEDLSALPEVKDAVDYFDLMRQTFKLAKMPENFKYSQTNAEQLGKKQFAFLDVTSSEGTKRMYATVKKGYAIMFSLSYTNNEDLETMRKILSEGNFALK